MSNKSRFAELIQDPPIEVFELTRQYNESLHPNKVSFKIFLAFFRTGLIYNFFCKYFMIYANLSESKNLGLSF